MGTGHTGPPWGAQRHTPEGPSLYPCGLIAVVPKGAKPRGQSLGNLVSQPRPSLPDSGEMPGAEGPSHTAQPSPGTERQRYSPPWSQMQAEREGRVLPCQPGDAPAQHRGQRRPPNLREPAVPCDRITNFKPEPGRAQPGGPAGEAESPVPPDGQAPFHFLCTESVETVY